MTFEDRLREALHDPATRPPPDFAERVKDAVPERRGAWRRSIRAWAAPAGIAVVLVALAIAAGGQGQAPAPMGSSAPTGGSPLASGPTEPPAAPPTTAGLVLAEVADARVAASAYLASEYGVACMRGGTADNVGLPPTASGLDEQVEAAGVTGDDWVEVGVLWFGTRLGAAIAFGGTAAFVDERSLWIVRIVDGVPLATEIRQRRSALGRTIRFMGYQMAPCPPTTPSPPITTRFYDDGIPRTLDGEPILRGEAIAARIALAVDDAPFLIGGYLAPRADTACPRPPDRTLLLDPCGRAGSHRLIDGPPGLPGGTSYDLVLEADAAPVPLPEFAIVLRVHVHDRRAATCPSDLLSRCETAIVVEDVVHEAGLGFPIPWTFDGERVPMYVAAMSAGSASCGWESVRFVGMGWPLGEAHTRSNERTYVRDPNGIYPGETAGAFRPAARLPADAVFTGYRIGDIELWMSPSTADAAIYIVRGEVVERWPRLVEQLGCM